MPAAFPRAPGVNVKSKQLKLTLNLVMSFVEYPKLRPSIFSNLTLFSVISDPLYFGSPVKHFIVTVYPLLTSSQLPCIKKFVIAAQMYPCASFKMVIEALWSQSTTPHGIGMLRPLQQMSSYCICIPPKLTSWTKNVMSSKPEKFTSKLFATWIPKSFIVNKKSFKLFSFEKAVVRFAAAPSKFPSDTAINIIYLRGEMIAISNK